MQLVSTDGLGRALGPPFAQHQLSAFAAADAPDGPLQDSTGVWTAAETAEAADRLAAAVCAALAGDGPGRMVALCLPAGDRRVVATVRAVWRCGNDVVVVDPTWDAEIVADVLRSAEADLVVTGDTTFRWPDAPVLVVPSADSILALPQATALQRACWDSELLARRAAS